MLSFRDSMRHSAEMLEMGFTHIPSSEVVMSEDSRVSFEALRNCFDELEPDSATRRRAYMQLVLMPGFDEVDLSRGNSAVLGSSYWQSAEHNAEAGGEVRRFAELPSAARSNLALRELIVADYRLTAIRRIYPAAGLLPILVGVHLLRMVATPVRPAVALPNRPHKDGEFFTFNHLLSRDGVEGGETEFYANGPDETVGKLLFRAALKAPLETFGMCDWAGYHHVDEVRAAPHRALGVRDNVLIDFTPLTPVYMGVSGRPRTWVPPMDRAMGFHSPKAGLLKVS